MENEVPGSTRAIVRSPLPIRLSWMERSRLDILYSCYQRHQRLSPERNLLQPTSLRSATCAQTAHVPRITLPPLATPPADSCWCRWLVTPRARRH